MKRLALFMLLVCSSPLFAGWDTNAWPSTNYARFTDTNMLVSVTNVYAKSWEQDICVTSSVSVDGWKTGYWKYELPNGATSDIPWVGLGPATSLWEMFSLDNVESNYFYLTNYNSWLTEIEQELTNTLSFSETNTLTNIYFTVSGNATNLVTNTITEISIIRGVGIQTNMLMDAKDLRAWDCWHAVDERIQLLNWYNPPISINIYDTKFYRDQRENLSTWKSSLPITYFVNRSLADNNGLYDTWFSNNEAQVSLPEWSVTGLLTHVGAPTNYLDYTPYRQLDGIGIGYQRIETGTYTIAVSGTNIGTNTVFGVFRDWTNDIVGTNGFVTNLPSTNVNIQVGFTSLDYGWKYMTNVLNELVWIEDGIAGWISPDNGISNTYHGEGAHTSSWATAVSDATAAFGPTNDAKFFGWGVRTEGFFGAFGYEATARAKQQYPQLDTDWTNRIPGTTFDVDVYAIVSIETLQAGISTFNDNGDTVYTNRLFYIGSQTNMAGEHVDEVIAGNTNLPVFSVDAPASNEQNWVGYHWEADDANLAAVKFDGTNGFEYK